MDVVITATLGVICLVIAGLIWWKVPPFRFAPILQIGLLITGSVGIANTFAGQWIRGIVGWLSDGLSMLFGRFMGAAVPWALALLFAFVVVFDLVRMFKDKSKQIEDAGGFTGASAFLLPMTAGAIPGVVGTAVLAMVAAISNGVGATVAAAFGME